MGLEEQTFEQTARQLKQQLQVDIYPKSSIFRSAKQRGEIDEAILEKKLTHWLDSHQPGMQRETAEAFCKAALKLDEIPEKLLRSRQVEKLAKQAARGTIDDQKTRLIKPLSVFAGQKTAHLLDHHVINGASCFSMNHNRHGGFHIARKGFTALGGSLLNMIPPWRERNAND